ncbi:reverse transcriptase [Penicillium capsulatum]|uniref:Reverse transcriptase n=1 Tax=Penicillium capsulatum TaxID=69766 RepID=A0A9W9LGY3_9EURO|nr:reverse transcriptase [Penicillium capsulatum]KAJ6105410.1 reverse transcriptase [Penicillium capsulatum]
MDPYLTRTVQSLTRSKIHELEKRRNAYEARKSEILEDAAKCSNLRERVERLLGGFEELSPESRYDAKILNMKHWIEQARYDSSITPEKLEAFERHLQSLLDAKSRRLSLADLYSRLLTEWMSPSSAGEAPPSEDEDFQIIEEGQKQRLQQLCDQFEAVVFEPHATDPKEINGFLNGIFAGEDRSKSLKNLREEVDRELQRIWKEKDPFTVSSLSNCIRGIQSEDIVSEEKQETLKHFLGSDVALNEIADVLNMRYADLSNWNWHAGDEGVPVLPRQELNGKYRIWMDDDVLETIFVQHICIRICVKLKSILKDFVSDDFQFNFRQTPGLTTRDQLRRKFYLTSESGGDSVKEVREKSYLENFFMATMPSSERTLADRGGGYDDDVDEDDKTQQPKQRNVKQQLLRKIVTETLLQHRLHGEAAVVQTDLHWFGTSIPHSTVYTILEFVGFPPKWIDFFHKYLETPLNMDKSFDGHEKVGPRKRQRGIPIAHASEKLVGELVLFFMDLAVNSETGMVLYRLHDDIWFSGEPEKCARTWETMKKFVNATGLQFNDKKTGSVCLGDSVRPEVKSQLPQGPVKIGFLTLDAATGDWAIDQSQVVAHVKQLKTQLDKCNSVISWVRTWNSCIGRFFKNTFGEPAYCFGRPHVDAILSTYQEMHRVIFDTENTDSASTITAYLREKISSRFGTLDIPDAFIFLPETLGGLGVRNPFVSVFLTRSELTKSPMELVQDFMERERQEYDQRKTEFEKASRPQRLNRLKQLGECEEGPPILDGDIDVFMSFDEWVKFRESTSRQFARLYQYLQAVPRCVYPRLTGAVQGALERAEDQFDVDNLSPEMRWTIYMYADDLIEMLGGLNMVEKQFLPLGVLDMMKGKKVRWQMVL